MNLRVKPHFTAKIGQFFVGDTLQLKIPLISLWRWVARRPCKVLSVISINIAWKTHLGALFPAGFDRGLAIDLKSYDAQFVAVATASLETEFHENNNIFIFHPDKHKRNWKIASTINVTYAPIQINWATI